MHKSFLCLYFSLVTLTSAFAQEIEIGTTIGFSNYFGDLAPTPVLTETKPAGAIFGRYNISSSFAFTGSFSIGLVSGSDQNFTENQYRNLSFRSNIYEMATLVEFNFFKYGIGVLDKPYTTYIFAGIAATGFNPQANVNGIWIDLPNIQTEGKKYSTLALSVPFGMGFKWRLTKHFALEGNVGFRRLYSDYLDDVSGTYPNVLSILENNGELAAFLSDRSVEISGQPFTSKEGYRRGNSDFDDWYIMGGISLTYRFYSRIKCSRFY